MEKQMLIPQVLFSGMVRQVHDLNYQPQQPFWQFPEEEYIKQIIKISNLLDILEQKHGTAVIWVVVEEIIKQREMYSIEQKLESLFQQYISNEWEIEVLLIPGSSNSTIEDFRFEVERYVHKLFIRFPFENFAQVVGFGEVMPYQAIFLEGIRQFSDRYVSLYWNNENYFFSTTTPSVPSVSWIKQFRDFIFDHDYQTALKLLSEVKETNETTALKYLLQMMIDRMNFAFKDAEEHLEAAINLLDEHPILIETRNIINQLLSKDIKIRDINRIIELYRQLDIYLDMDDTSSFIVRFYRAREAVLYYLQQHAQTIEHEVKSKKNSSIYQVIEDLEQKYDSWEIDGYYGTYFYLKSKNVAKALEVRNQSFLGHGRSGIQSNQLWYSYFGTSKTTIEKAKRRFIMDTSLMFRDLGVELDENIMNLNKFILHIVSRQFLKGTESDEEYIYTSVD